MKKGLLVLFSLFFVLLFHFTFKLIYGIMTKNDVIYRYLGGTTWVRKRKAKSR